MRNKTLNRSIWLKILFLLIMVGGIYQLARAAEPPIGRPPTESDPPQIEIAEPDEASAPVESRVAATSFVFMPLTTKPKVCQLTAEEEAIAQFAINHAGQGRSTMACDPILTQVARAKALDMGTRSYFGHTDPDGFGPNYYIRQAGYSLPGWYGSANNSNNVESIAAGYGSATAAWNGWMNSSGHKTHLLGESSFFADQTKYGIGYAYVPGSPYRHYWVFLSAPPQN